MVFLCRNYTEGRIIYFSAYFFNDAVNSSDHIKTKDKMITNYILNSCERKRS
jgi:hypothetical protein